jgi:hypothetical protein
MRRAAVCRCFRIASDYHHASLTEIERVIDAATAHLVWSQSYIKRCRRPGSERAVAQIMVQAAKERLGRLRQYRDAMLEAGPRDKKGRPARGASLGAKSSGTPRAAGRSEGLTP